MKPWQDKAAKRGQWVKDTKGEYGRGQIVALEPYGALVLWESGIRHFLGFHWLEAVPSPAERQQCPSGHFEFTLPEC